MQPVSWYINRLKTMSPGEIRWRIASIARDNLDRIRIPLKLYPSMHTVCGQPGGLKPPGFSVSSLPTGAWADSKATPREQRWLSTLLQKADLILAHRLSYFDLRDHDHGQPFNWHFDHSAGKASPLRFATSIDYRDFQETGDCKLIWEANRHHHLVVLGRAYRASGNPVYAQGVCAQLESWLDANPYGYGMNWRSPMELAIRMINWVWALDLIRDSGIMTEAFLARIHYSVYLHLRDVTRKYSQGSSANNHLIGEAAGVFIACCYFPGLPNAETWKQQSLDLLCREILAQMTSEGCHRELALGYHYFVLQFFLFAGIAGRQSSMEFPASYWSAMETMLTFLSHLAEGGTPPLYGDCDDGYVLDLGNGPHDFASLLAIGATLFNRADFKALGGDRLEALAWLRGEKGLVAYDRLALPQNQPALVSHAFSEAGLYLLQNGPQGQDAISVLIDCGELGFQTIAAHGHADALSFSLRIGGEDILVDPGTYDYFTFPEWRTYFRSTRAHNTVEVDNEDQSVMLGPFLWGKRATSRCLLWAPSSHGGRFTGEHDGYTRLQDPVLHRRTMELDGSSQTLTVIDEIEAKSAHRTRVFFHCSPACHVEKEGPHSVRISNGDRKVLITFDPKLALQLFSGSTHPIAGWASASYHCRQPVTTIVAEKESNGSCRLQTVLSLARH